MPDGRLQGEHMDLRKHVAEAMIRLKEFNDKNGPHVDECTFWLIDHKTFMDIQVSPESRFYLEVDPSGYKLAGYSVMFLSPWLEEEQILFGDVEVSMNDVRQYIPCMSLQTVSKKTRRVSYIDTSITHENWKVK